MIQEALCQSYLKHTNGCPHRFLLPCSSSMELIPSVPRDRATSAWEQRPKCLPLNFQSIFRAHFNRERGKKIQQHWTKHERKKRKGEKIEWKSTNTLEPKHWLLAQAWLPQHEQQQLCFPSFLSLLFFLSCFPLLTRTQPICSEGRVTDRVDKPCSRAFPWDASLPTTLSFLSQLLLGMWGAVRDARAQLCETSLLSHICSATIH